MLDLKLLEVFSWCIDVWDAHRAVTSSARVNDRVLPHKNISPQLSGESCGDFGMRDDMTLTWYLEASAILHQRQREALWGWVEAESWISRCMGDSEWTAEYESPGIQKHSSILADKHTHIIRWYCFCFCQRIRRGELTYPSYITAIAGSSADMVSFACILLVPGIEKIILKISQGCPTQPTTLLEKSCLFPKHSRFCINKNPYVRFSRLCQNISWKIRGEEFAPATSDRSAALSFFSVAWCWGLQLAAVRDGNLFFDFWLKVHDVFLKFTGFWRVHRRWFLFFLFCLTYHSSSSSTFATETNLKSL